MNDPHSSHAAGFPSTLWTVIRNAGDPAEDAARRRESLGKLISRYWKPVYWYLRLSCGRDAATAMDLAQGFFLRILETDFLAKADETRGRFRNFLKTSLRHFATDQHRSDRAVQRGGGALHLPFEAAELESAELLAAGRELGPDRVFEREWAATVVRNAIAEVKRRLADQEHSDWFEVFRLHDLEGDGQARYRDVAGRLGMSVDDVHNRLRVAREMFRECVCAEVRETVGSPAELDEELRELFSWMK